MSNYKKHVIKFKNTDSDYFITYCGLNQDDFNNDFYEEDNFLSYKEAKEIRDDVCLNCLKSINKDF